MPTKLKYSITILTIFITGLLSGLFLADISGKPKNSEANQTELVRTALWIIIPKEAQEIEMLTQVITGMSKRNPQDTKNYICKLVDLKVNALESTRQGFKETINLKDSNVYQTTIDSYNRYIDMAKLDSARAGCRK